MSFYVYAYMREDGTPYYIGKGIGNRAWVKGKGEVYPPKNKLYIRIIESNLTEIGAFAIERRLIKWYGRKDTGTGILRNKSDGGEGPSGAVRSPETIKKLRESRLGKTFTKEHRENLSTAHKGKSLTESHKENIKKSTIERFSNPIERQKLSKKGGENSNATVWKITDPAGKTVIVTGLDSWCRENNVPRDRIRLSQCGWIGEKLGKKKNFKEE